MIDFESDDQTEFVLAPTNRRSFDDCWMERHFKHTQGFIPLNHKPFAVVPAPPNNDNTPDLDKVEPFRLDLTTAFFMKLGTWHEFPFALQDDTNVIVLL